MHANSERQILVSSPAHLTPHHWQHIIRWPSPPITWSSTGGGAANKIWVSYTMDVSLANDSLEEGLVDVTL